MITREDFSNMIMKLIAEGILIQIDETESILDNIAFNFPFDSDSIYLYHCRMLDLTSSKEVDHVRFYEYRKEWWRFADEDCDSEYLNEPKRSDLVTYRRYTTVGNAEKYIRQVFVDANKMIEKLKADKLVKEIENL